MADGSESTLGILGAGTMGAGIAQVAATAGWTVQLMDVDGPTVRAAIDGIAQRLDRLVEKRRLSPSQRDAARQRLEAAAAPQAFSPCQIVIEAVVEDYDTKVTALRPIIPFINDDAVIATNTSSLSIGRLGDSLGEPHRTVGMHFFNPAPLMKLVEVIAGSKTDPIIAERAVHIAESWGKIVARAADTPGFIVNHVARPYYLEAFRILEDGYADAQEIDDAMRELGGFRMGPLELTDLIGQDVNTATTRSVWAALEKPPLLRPSPLQEQLVRDGHLGRKSGRGVYLYKEGMPPGPDLAVRRRPLAMGETLRQALDGFVTAATDERRGDLHDYVFARILVALIVQAALAHERGVATKPDIDTALKYGTNYPKGPFEWAQQIGHDRCARLLEALNQTVDDNRFAGLPERPTGTRRFTAGGGRGRRTEW